MTTMIHSLQKAEDALVARIDEATASIDQQIATSRTGAALARLQAACDRAAARMRDTLEALAFTVGNLAGEILAGAAQIAADFAPTPAQGAEPVGYDEQERPEVPAEDDLPFDPDPQPNEEIEEPGPNTAPGAVKKDGHDELLAQVGPNIAARLMASGPPPAVAIELPLVAVDVGSLLEPPTNGRHRGRRKKT